jgi:hypothetical protein
MALLTGLILLMSLTACGTSASSSTEENAVEESIASEAPENQESEKEIVEESQTVDDDWGVWESQTATNDGGENEDVYIKFPDLAGVSYGAGKVATQLTQTTVVFGRQWEESSSVTSVDEVFLAYQDDASYSIKKYRDNWDYDNFQFEITSQEHTEINGYQMCRYEGIHSYTDDGELVEMQYVAYAAQLKGNGAYVYWVVIDESEDQSLGDLISENAEKMAWTLEEKAG